MLDTAKALPGGQKFKITGTIRDGNVAILLKDGTRVECLRPNRVGRQYDYANGPIDGRPGSREWNIDPIKTLGECSNDRNGFFVVGTWGTAYNATEDVLATIPFSEVAGFEELTAPPCLTGCTLQPGHHYKCSVTAGCYARQVGITTSEAVDEVLAYVQQLGVEEFLGFCSKVIKPDKLLELMQQLKS